MQIVTLIGNRPQFVKAAAVSRRLRERSDELLVHSGQHYDDQLSEVFFEELDLPRADVELAVGPASEAIQMGEIMQAFEPVVLRAGADLVMVYGDTTTTVAGAMSAAKLGLPLVHVEAGMRSFDRSMPEERNRILSDHLASLCLCSTETAVGNLQAEQVQADVVLVGDVMADVSLAMAQVASARTGLREQLGLSAAEYLLVTAHRAGNVDDPKRLTALVELLEALPLPAVFPVHPRTRERLEQAGLSERVAAVETLHLTEPLGYLDFMGLLAGATAVLTDSGGVQKEAYLAKVPCITLRDTTEWVETVASGWNCLVDLDRQAALAALAELPRAADHPDLYGGGSAGENVIGAIEGWARGRPA
jgi:UDP-N-acetylglucosamine 2-epimerase (non-hydrolysing)/UDP-GlcNAc3NAcA epimerase